MCIKIKLNCAGCLWEEPCGRKDGCKTEDEREGICSHFSPAEVLNDSYIHKIVEHGRLEFHDEWSEYLRKMP